MDYEKAYKEALERARAMIKVSANQDEAIGFANTIFPELAEDEDEKFRKYILKCCEETISADDRGLELSMDTTIKLKNWLEKQGERNPAWSEEDKNMIDNIIDYMNPMPIFFESTKGKSGKEYTQEFVKNAINWLKSLKERYTWKPNKKQIGNPDSQDMVDKKHEEWLEKQKHL